jgi:hypothetical protein
MRIFMRRLFFAILSLMCFSAIFCLPALLQADSKTAVDPHSVPEVAGELGPCSVVFTVNDAKGSPVYNAKIRVHIAYGFLNAHKLDLEVGTNIDGKGKFTGLPNRLKQPLNFEISEGEREGSATFDPVEGCRVARSVNIAKPPDEPDQPQEQ